MIHRMGTGTRKRRDRRRSRRRGGSRTVAGMAANPLKPARPAGIWQADHPSVLFSLFWQDVTDSAGAFR